MSGPQPCEPALTQDRQRSARRLQTMLRHSTHLFFALLWCIAMVPALRGGAMHGASLGGWWILGCYLGGLRLQAVRPDAAGRRLVGCGWVALLVLSWAVLAVLSSSWVWLCFPLFFLTLFIWPARAAWAGVGAMAVWAGISPALRGDGFTPGGLIGPLFGAGVAVIGWLVIQQLMRDAAEQRRLAGEVTRAHEQILGHAREQARTAEREALARDLHDSLAQGLNSIVLLSRSASVRHPSAAEDLHLIEQTARQNLQEARRMVRQMAPAPDGVSLVEELGSLVAVLQRQVWAMDRLLQIELRVDGDERRVSPAISETVVQATRASLANVVQHARASRCVVSLAFLPDELTLDIVDDGLGFVVGSAGPDSFGLRALDERIAAVGGSIEVDSAPGQGTTIGIRVPCPARDQEL